jgi:hypothetical protein
MVYDEPESINTLTRDVVEEWHKRYGHLPLKSFYSIQEAAPDWHPINLSSVKHVPKANQSRVQARHKPTRFLQ